MQCGSTRGTFEWYRHRVDVEVKPLILLDLLSAGDSPPLGTIEINHLVDLIISLKMIVSVLTLGAGLCVAVCLTACANFVSERVPIR